jgi:cytochrome c5
MSSTNQKGSKTPGEMLKVGSMVFIVPIVVLIFLIKMNLGSGGTDRASMAPEMVLSRIAPVAHYNTGAPLPEEGDKQALTGEQVYNRLCMTCHDTGVTDAPIKGNLEQWAPRIAQGADVLFQHSLEGFNAMPAKGGDASLLDEEVKNAVVFMVNASGGDISLDSSDAAPAEAEEAVEEVEATEEVVEAEETATDVVEEEPAPAAEEAVEEAEATETEEAAMTVETEAQAAEVVEIEAQEAIAPENDEPMTSEEAAPEVTEATPVGEVAEDVATEITEVVEEIKESLEETLAPAESEEVTE